jgi:hypothetical protein
MRMNPINRFERNIKDSFITISFKKAIRTTTTLFHGREKPDVQLIQDGVNKFPIETAGNNMRIVRNISP